MTFLCVPEKCDIITLADKETPILCTAHNCEHVADFTDLDDECRCWRKKEDA